MIQSGTLYTSFIFLPKMIKKKCRNSSRVWGGDLSVVRELTDKCKYLYSSETHLAKLGGPQKATPLLSSMQRRLADPRKREIRERHFMGNWSELEMKPTQNLLMWC